MSWTQKEALQVCRMVEQIAPLYECHVALTGGCLYKEGERKDLDLLFYPHKNNTIKVEGLFEALQDAGILILKDDRPLANRHWLYRAESMGRRIDCFFYYHKQGYGEDGEGNY